MGDAVVVIGWEVREKKKLVGFTWGVPLFVVPVVNATKRRGTCRKKGE